MRRGFRWNRNGAASGSNVTGTLELWAEDDDSPDDSDSEVTNPVLVMDENGRLSTRTHSGAVHTVPDSYSFGEAIELRYTFAETGNSQRQGLFLNVRQSAANSSTVRGTGAGEASAGAPSAGIGSVACSVAV